MNEDLEFSIMQYLDGDLSPAEVLALEARLLDDAEARTFVEEQKKLTAVLRSQPLPELPWIELGRDFSTMITGSVDEHSRASDVKLNALLKSATVPVPEMRWEILASQISDHVNAGISVRDQADDKLDELLHAAPMPAILWDKLTTSISRQIDDSRALEIARPQIKTYSMKWVHRASRYAVAACVLLAAAVIFRMNNNGGGNSNVSTDIVPQIKVAMVETPKAEVAPSAGVMEISIGPSKTYAAVNPSESHVNRSPVVIVMPAGRADDGDRGVFAFD